MVIRNSTDSSLDRGEVLGTDSGVEVEDFPFSDVYSSQPSPRKQHATRCVLLCGGRGIRLAPFTDDKPKAFVPVQGTPIIIYALITLRKALPRIQEYTIVTGCFHEFWERNLPILKEAVKGSSLTLVNNPSHDENGPAKSLQLAVNQWGHDKTYDNVCVVYGDILFTETILHRLFDVPLPAIAVDRDFRKNKPQFGQDCIELVALNQDRVAAIGKRVNKEFAFGEYMGICVLPKESLTNFTWVQNSTNMADFLTDVARNYKMSAVSFMGNWKEINSYNDVLAAHADVYFLPNEVARKKYVEDIGRRLLGEANDIKRPLELVASEMGLAKDIIPALMNGTLDVDIAQQLLHKVCRHYPCSMTNLWVDPDDTYNGVLLMTPEASEASARVLSRPTASGKDAPYYEYRDTSMSRLAPFRPEWIRMIRVVHDDDPNNPDVVYNKGHLLFQVTFFVGPVNFYYIKPDGTKVCERMNTGDTNWIASFVPHTFARRGDGNEPAYIVACTYGARLAQSVSSINALRRGVSSNFKGRLKRQMEVEIISEEYLINNVGETARNVILGHQECTWDVAQEIATVLDCRPEDLMATDVPSGEVIVHKTHENDEWRPFPSSSSASYAFRKCARQCHQPLVKTFEIELKPPGGVVYDVSLHQYLFNYSERSCAIEWDNGITQPLEPNGSVYIRPTIPFSLKSDYPVRLFSVGIPGDLTPETFSELGLCDKSGYSRIGAETTRWY